MENFTIIINKNDEKNHWHKKRGTKDFRLYMLLKRFISLTNEKNHLMIFFIG
ncbi:hypothetical protein HMPREF0083_04566 [Aneurinibacillus aneurinilyticus ATCC 12856]|uniref:Uncharacterized protein n=1 Tax=Aneurinibacillus aneurinilyticus ATCC 12856 TaxID=649747 RepID=U1WFM8_ANEAE|nr:hypothetical protein HMPREF0083_04566 [Aneurinibacillus aneurinilyticus ATCC 12856]